MHTAAFDSLAISSKALLISIYRIDSAFPLYEPSNRAAVFISSSIMCYARVGMLAATARRTPRPQDRTSFVSFINAISLLAKETRRDVDGDYKEAQTEAQTYEGTLYLDARHYPTAPVNLWQRAPFARAARHARGFAPWFPKRAT